MSPHRGLIDITVHTVYGYELIYIHLEVLFTTTSAYSRIQRERGINN